MTEPAEQGRPTLVIVLTSQGAANFNEIELEGILDFDSEGRMVGIEVLWLGRQMGIAPRFGDARSHGGSVSYPISSPAGPAHLSFDSEADALYLKLADRAAPVQRHGDVVFAVDDLGLIHRIDIFVR